MKRPDPMKVRDCFQQIKSIRRLMLNLIDDLGDLSASLATEPNGEPFGAMSDKVSDFEHYLHQTQGALETMSQAPQGSFKVIG